MTVSGSFGGKSWTEAYPIPDPPVGVIGVKNINGLVTDIVGANFSYVLAQTGVPSGIAPSGYVGANGALNLAPNGPGSIVFGATTAGAQTVTGTGTAFASTDIGKVIIVDGGKLCPITAWTSATVVTATVPTGGLTTGTFANTAWQFGSAFAIPYTHGIYLYFPAGALFSGSLAGSYWAVMSSTTAGTVYNTMMSGYAAIPTTTTPIVDAGPGTYTAVVATIFPLASISIPGGTVGPNGACRISHIGNNNVSAGTKNYRTSFGGVVTTGNSNSTQPGFGAQSTVRNKGVTNAQSANNSSYGEVGMGGAFAQLSVDTTQNTTASVSGQIAANGDWMIIEGVTLEILPT